MTPDFRYEVLTAKVAHEVVDGEVIVLQFDTGYYFSIASEGVELWKWMIEGASHRQIVDAFVPLREDQLRRLQAFFEVLESEKIVKKTELKDVPAPVACLPTRPVPFPNIVLERYGDMQDLLVADPIHEVDATGWPSVPPRA
jgi:hypothetical protein